MESPSKLNNSEKRKPKGPVKFHLTLNEEQKAAKAGIHSFVLRQ